MLLALLPAPVLQNTGSAEIGSGRAELGQAPQAWTPAQSHWAPLQAASSGEPHSGRQ